MFGTILVSMTGIALPILLGVWFMPRSDSNVLAAAPQIWLQGKRGQWLRQGRGHLGSLSAAVRPRHLSGSIAQTSAGRAG
jgi:hypothetical protein